MLSAIKVIFLNTEGSLTQRKLVQFSNLFNTYMSIELG